MANNCLVTKLKAVVNNPDLLKIGEFRIHVSSIANPTTNTQGIQIGLSDTVEAYIINGEGHFTDSTLTQDLGQHITMQLGTNNYYVSNGDFDISIMNREKINRFMFMEAFSTNHRHMSFDVGLMNIMSNLTFVNVSNSGVYGRIEEGLKNKTALERFYASSCSSLAGDLSAFSNNDYIKHLYLNGTNVTGTLESIGACTALINIDFTENSGISGNIGALGNAVNMTSISMNNCRQVGGDIIGIKDLTSLTTLNVANTLCTGSLSALRAYLTNLTNVNISGTSITE